MRPLVYSCAFTAELSRLEIPKQVIPEIPSLQDRIPWNCLLYPVTDRLRLVGKFNANRKTLAKIEGIFVIIYVGLDII